MQEFQIWWLVLGTIKCPLTLIWNNWQGLDPKRNNKLRPRNNKRAKWWQKKASECECVEQWYYTWARRWRSQEFNKRLKNLTKTYFKYAQKYEQTSFKVARNPGKLGFSWIPTDDRRRIIYYELVNWSQMKFLIY